MVIGLSDTNYYIDGIRVEKWDSATIIPSNGSAGVPERIGSKIDTLRAISFNANGYSIPTVTTIKNAPNPPTRVEIGLTQRPRWWDRIGEPAQGSGLDKMLPDKPKDDLVSTNEAKVIWQECQNQKLPITAYKVKWEYFMYSGVPGFGD
ncbi:MAG: hypothetical protein MUO78_00110 [candidate division Zixibacteria bacterium]|nr:hypothetical protein [candidate division Zixibacteria bacterium]